VGGVPMTWAPMPIIAFACRGGEWACVMGPDDATSQVAVEGGFPIWLPNART